MWGDNHEYRGGCSVPWGTQITKDFSPHGTHDNPHGTHDIPHGTEHPHGTQDIPHGTEHPHGTAHTLYRVIITFDMVNKIFTVRIIEDIRKVRPNCS